MDTSKKTKFTLSPHSTLHDESDKTEPCVVYKPSYKENAYIEEEGGWFLEQGAKCTIQKTPKNSVATHGHLHDALEILYIKDGSFEAYINDVRYDVGRGDMLFFHSGDIHRVYSLDEEENSYYVIKIHPSLVFDIADKKNGAGYMLKFSVDDDSAKRVWRKNEIVGTRVEKTVISLAEECKNRRPFFDIAVKEYAASLLRFILRTDNRTAVPRARGRGSDDSDVLGSVYNALTFIKNNYQNDISALEVASAVGMSYSSFSRSFGRIVGQSFKEHLNFVRIRRAEELLITGDDSVEEIAERCGYRGSSYFIMLFKKIKGLTPHAYRNAVKHRGEEETQKNEN